MSLAGGIWGSGNTRIKNYDKIKRAKKKTYKRYLMFHDKN